MDERLSTDDILARFSDPDLAAHAYLDVTLRRHNPLTQQAELHSQSAQLLSQLDHATEELTWRLEALMAELKRSGPRLAYQLELLRSGVAGLVADVADVAAPHVAGIGRARARDQAADQAVARLQQLETVRRRMGQARAVLQEVQAFDEAALAAEVARLVDDEEDRDLEAALRVVERAAELLQVWKGTSVYAARAKFVAQLRKKIEAAVAQPRDAAAQEQQGQGPDAGARQRAGTASPAGSRPGTPAGGARRSQESEGSYYGLLGQLQRKIGY